MKRLLKKKVNIFGKEISAFVIALFGVALVSAALIPYFGQIICTVTVSQGLTLDGKSWDDATITYSESLTSLEAKMISSGKHLLENGADTSAVANLDTVCTGTDCGQITTTHDTVGLSTTWSWVAGANADASISEDTVTLTVAGSPSQAPWVASEARIRIDADDVENLLGLGSDLTLNDIKNISWDVNVNSGYIAHVDILIDTTSDDLADDALVFEYAKVNPAHCEETPYPAGPMNTFGTLGIVDDNAQAWLSSGNAGPLCTLNKSARFYIYTLSDWKVGQTANSKTISGTTKVIALEIEVDAWIYDSESEVKDILINTIHKPTETLNNPVNIASTEDLTFYVNTDFPKMLTPETYTLTTTVNPA